MIRGHPLRKTGSAASHGGLSTELFYYKSRHLATGKKQMWRVSQKIHRGSLAFFGKWDKINRIRGMPRPQKCAAERNPPVTASPCQPPLGKGALGRGYGLPRPVTGAEEIRVSFRDQSADWSWESVIPLHKSKGDADCHSQCAHWLRNDTLQVVRWGGPMWGAAPTKSVYTLYFYILKSERKHEL